MSVSLQGKELHKLHSKVDLAWAEINSHFDLSDDAVAIRCVKANEIKKLNRKYRDKDSETNVLTFTYGDGQHDIALCLKVAQSEAKERDVEIGEYIMLLIVHGLLHVAGLDHERSEEEVSKMRSLEQRLLHQVGVKGISL